MAGFSPKDVIINETNVYQPDVLFFRHKGEAKLGKRCVEGPPDFVVEILSESTAHLDRDLKRGIYARAGVKELWFVDPETKQISIFELGKSADKPRASHSGDDMFTSPIFPGLNFACAEIFRGI